MAKTGKIFRPAEISHNEDSANVFVMTEGEVSYLVVLNYSISGEYVNEIDLKKLFGADGTEPVKELWSGETQTLQDGKLHIQLGAKDAKVYRVGTVKTSDDARPTPDPTVPPKPTDEPEATATPGATMTPKPTEKPEATATPEATVTPKPTEKPEAAATPGATMTP